MRPLRLLASSVILGLFAANACFQGEGRDFSAFHGGGGSGPDASVGGTGGDGGSGGAPGGTGGLPDGSVSECTSDADCSDAVVCNGTERCQGGVCADAASPAPDQTDCTRTRLRLTPQNIFEPFEVDGVCLGGECREPCQALADCDDLNPCTGQETCNASQGLCVYGQAIECNDNNECTVDVCDPIGGVVDNNFCTFALVDVDEDGHAPQALGLCGDDCDDSDPSAYTGAQQLCGDVDTDCDPATTGITPTWYADCDNDGFANQRPNGVDPVESHQQCDAPGSGPALCVDTGGWTLVSPFTSTRVEDCNDGDAESYPGADDCGGVNSKDDNCDGVLDGIYYYVDCDGDSYAESTVGLMEGALNPAGAKCSPPASIPASCVAAVAVPWTTKYPEGSDKDCLGKDGDRYFYPNTVPRYEPTIDPDDAYDDWDYNCNGTVEQEYTVTSVTSDEPCTLEGGECTGVKGWVSDTAAECGTTADLSICSCAADDCAECIRVAEPTTQGCH